MTSRHPTRRRLLLAGGTALAGAVAGGTDALEGGGQPSPQPTPHRTPTPSPRPTTASPSATTTATPGSAGTGPTNDDDLPGDSTPMDGYPPAFDPAPSRLDYDASTFKRVERDGVQVPLVPLEVAYNWYARHEARFVDARSRTAFDAAHIYGAVLSPAPDGREANDPTSQWPADDRTVCYCDCPHHLSSLRAATLLQRGFSTVFAIDEGFVPWVHRNYPMAGTDVGHVPSVRTITGTAGEAAAGGTAWAFHEPSGQQEATGIDVAGRYTLELKFLDVTDASMITVRTPAYRLTASLGRLTSTPIAADGTLASEPPATPTGSASY